MNRFAFVGLALTALALGSPGARASDRIELIAAEPQGIIHTDTGPAPVHLAQKNGQSVPKAGVSARNSDGIALLLEASANGSSSVTTFTGAVEWSMGTEDGLPTILAAARMRDLSVKVIVRHNTDHSLPATHIIEFVFEPAPDFKGGSIASLPGLLLKDEKLEQGTPLVGATARVVGNSFLFAASGSPDAKGANGELLTKRRWLDIAIIYETGRRAIITLERDELTLAMFRDAAAAWAKAE